MQRYHIVVHSAARLLLDVNTAHAYILLVGFFHAVKVQSGVIANEGLDNLCGQETLVVEGVVAKQELGLGLRFNDDKHAPINHQVYLCMQDIDNLYGLFDLYTTRNIHQKPVLCQHRVECRYGIARRCGQLTIVFGDEIGIFLCVLTQRSNDNAIGKLLVGRGGLQESIVNHKMIGRA